MRLFRYRAIDPYGEPLEGTMEEESAARVTAVLQERGAQVNEVLEVGRPPRRLVLKRALSWADVSLLNNQLLSIVKGQIPVAPSVQAMAKDVDNAHLKPVFEHLRSELEAGRSLEEALQGSPRPLPPVYVSLVRAGERSGNLAGVLEIVSGYSTRILEFRDRMFLAMLYPVSVLFVTGIVLLIIFRWVVPQYAAIFTDFGGRLPAPTQLLVNISTFAQNYPVEIAVAFGVAALFVLLSQIRFRRTGFVSPLMDRLRERMPIGGSTYRAASIARFSKALGLMLEAGVPIGEALDLAGGAAANEHLRARVRKASVHISNGDRVADAFSDTRYFPHSYLWFLANGESRGQLPQTLIELSENNERIVSVRDEAVLQLVTPIAILMLGGVVLFVIVSLYLPIFSLGDALTTN